MTEASGAPAFRIVTLTATDSSRYDAFLSEGCRQHPETLRIAPEDVAATPFSTLDSAEGCTLLARSPEGEWLGVGSLERDRGREKRRHVAWIMRMLVVAPGRGIGRALLRELIHRASAMEGVTKLNLTVAAHNTGAVALYASEGFTEFSREDDAFRSGARRVTELSMSRALP